LTDSLFCLQHTKDFITGEDRKVKAIVPLAQLHPRARQAHEAPRCAKDQGQFWAYHDLLYAHASKASPDDLKTYAQDTGLDLPAFEQCLANGTYRAAVQQDVEDGARLGVKGMPAFFINGRLVSGAQPLDAFVQIIEDELQRASATK